MEKITLDKTTLKALIVDTRLDILKLLNNQKYTQSDLANLLKLSKPTIKDHLTILEDARLIKKEDTKRKWKYFSITLKGKRIVSPAEVNVMFAFLINIIAIVGVSIATALKVIPKPEPQMLVKSAPRAMVKSASMNFEASAISTTNKVAKSILPPWFYYALALILLTIFASFMLGFLLKKKTVIIKT